MTTENFTDEQAERLLKNIMFPRNHYNSVAAVLYDIDDFSSPKEHGLHSYMPMIRLAGIDNTIHINVCKEIETESSQTYEFLHQIAVDLEAFLAAVAAVIDKNAFHFEYKLTAVAD